MEIEVALRTHLANNPGLSAIISGRIYPVILPQETPQKPVLPAVTYQKVSSIEEYIQDGSTSLRRVRFQIDCWSRRRDDQTGGYNEAKTMATLVKAAVNRFSGLLGGVGGVQVGGVWLEDETDFYEPDTQTYRVSVDIRLIC